MEKSHYYKPTITWTGNLGKGTHDYKSYSRNHEIHVQGKPPIPGSSDPSFRGDTTRHSPEDLFVATLSSCHMLWYLHLCAVNGVIVEDYVDEAVGEMRENEDGSGQFKQVTLSPRVVVAAPSMIEKAQSLHAEANGMCFIARSVNFPVLHTPRTTSVQPV